jgi:hypothetical protein
MTTTSLETYDELLNYISSRSREMDLLVKNLAYANIPELSKYSPGVRNKLAEITLSHAPDMTIAQVLDENKKFTGTYRSISDSERIRILENVLPTCFKHLAPYLI